MHTGVSGFYPTGNLYRDAAHSATYYCSAQNTQLIVHGCLGPLGRRADPLAVDVEHIRHGDQQRREPGGDAHAGPDADVVIQGADDEGEGAGEARAQEGIRRDGGGRVRLERVDQVVEGGLEDGEEARAEHDEPDARDDPVDVLAGGPARHELAGAEQDGADHHGRQALLGHSAVSRRVVGLVVEGLVEHVGGGAEQGAEEDAEERQGGDEIAPAADLAKDEGDAAELHVEDAVAEARVERDEEADGGAEQLDGPDEELLG